ncbi:MAG: hypothetical protein V1850_01775 [Candidatus Bathyarchaeota archaeon]
MSRVAKKIRKLRIPSVSFRSSNSMLILFMVVIAIFILGGGVYDLMQKPISVLPTPSNPIFYYSGMTDQTLNESMIFILFLIIGISGGYLSFRSTRHAYRPREARMYIAIGVTMIIVAFIGCEAILALKGV